MQKNRFRLISAILFISVYMLSALVWWAFALTKNQETLFQKELDILNTQQQWAYDYVYHLLKSETFTEKNTPCATPSDSSATRTLYIDNEALVLDSTLIKAELSKKFPKINVNFMTKGQHKGIFLGLSINPDIFNELQNTRNSKIRAWVMEGITLGIITLLISLAMFFYVDKMIQLHAQQNNFLLAVTHELKTPIAASKLAIDTVLKSQDPKITERVLALAKGNIARLGRMVDQILLATKFESKFIDPVITTFELHELIVSSIEGLELANEQKELITLEIEESLFMKADESMMTIVLRNLITNALKYGQNKSIVIKAESMSNGFKICVIDYGIGIHDSDKKRVFEKFYRVGDEKTRSQPGSGLGLYLVKKITEIHGGRVTITDSQPAGSTFVLTFLNNSLSA
jgi:signal transduction histidine kinase